MDGVRMECAVEAEQWRPIDGWPGYEVSDQGRVRSFRTSQGAADVARILKATKQASGHVGVSLYAGEGRRGRRRKTVHTLVLKAFCGHPPPGTECCHDNGVPADNRLSNLYWGTKKQNAADRKRHGTQPLGTRHHNCKLAPWEIEAIRVHRGWLRAAHLAEIFGIKRCTVSAMQLGRNHVTAAGAIPKAYSQSTPETRAKAVRLAAEGRTQQEVARVLGVSQTSVSAWLRWHDPKGTRGKKNATGFKGVGRIGNRYQASFKENGRRRHIGCFETAEEAHAAYRAAVERYHGQFARTEAPEKAEAV